MDGFNIIPGVFQSKSQEGGDWTGQSNRINEEIIRKYAIICRSLTKIYSTWSPKYIRLTHDPFERTRGDYWTIFGRDWTEIYSTWSLVFVRQNHDPSGRTRGHCLIVFFGDWTEICWRWSLKCIGLHHDPSGRTRGDYFFFFCRDGWKYIHHDPWCRGWSITYHWQLC